MSLKSWRRKLSKSAGTQLRYMISLMAPIASVASSDPLCESWCEEANLKTTARSLGHDSTDLEIRAKKVTED